MKANNKLKSEIESAYKIKDKSQIVFKNITQGEGNEKNSKQIFPFEETQFIETVEEEVIAMDYDTSLYL